MLRQMTRFLSPEQGRGFLLPILLLLAVLCASCAAPPIVGSPPFCDFGEVRFDSDYATANGYGTLGRSAYVGARARF